MTTDPPGPRLFTIGHSNQTAARFVELLARHGIETLVDVRSAPYSRYCPHFNKPVLEASITAAGLRYVYLGDKLGGMPKDESLYDDTGSPDYDRIAAAPFFIDGIRQLIALLPDARCAMMCAEENPQHCHRHRLVEPALVASGIDIRHIRGDGRIESSEDLDSKEDKSQLRLF